MRWTRERPILRPHAERRDERAQPLKYGGSFPAFHLMLQPTLGFWSGLTGRPARTASRAARRSRPVTGLPLPGRAYFHVAFGGSA